MDILRRIAAAAVPFAVLATGCVSDDASGLGGPLPAEVAIEPGAGSGGASAEPSAAVAGGGFLAAHDAGAPVSANPDAAPQCSMATVYCSDDLECCDGLICDDNSLGTVCCGDEGAPCATADGIDCCGDLLCVDGTCGYPALEPLECEAPCKAAPALTLERQRLADIGGSWLGICGDANHTYGYHVPAARLAASDYSLEGEANTPVCEWYASAIDIGMDWPASRHWLMWLIEGIVNGDLHGIAEVIGSYDGDYVRYWSDNTGWNLEGIPYQGVGHDTWTHVAIHRSTAHEDHRILAGWSADGML